MAPIGRGRCSSDAGRDGYGNRQLSDHLRACFLTRIALSARRGLAIVRPIIFVHIPKTGGMTFAPIITRNFPSESVIQIDGINVSLASCGEQLSRLPDKSRAEIQCIHGHVPLGLHRWLSQPAAYITLLRNPVDRLVSAYYYSLRRPEWGFHERIVKQHLSLHEFAASEASAELHNAQTRMLSGSDEPVSTVDTLDTAKANLRQRFAFVGLTERFDESVWLCRKLLGLSGGFYLKKNINRRRVPLNQIPSRTVALIEEKNSLDLELYDVARRDFDRLVARFPGLPGDLARFRRWNACYGLAGSLLGLPFNLFRETTTAIRRAQVRNGRSLTKDSRPGG
ncbi:MAG: sulfotransferase family 2 domain-containing protein [Candidatus Binatus sp.]